MSARGFRKCCYCLRKMPVRHVNRGATKDGWLCKATDACIEAATPRLLAVGQ